MWSLLWQKCHCTRWAVFGYQEDCWGMKWRNIIKQSNQPMNWPLMYSVKLFTINFFSSKACVAFIDQVCQICFMNLSIPPSLQSEIRHGFLHLIFLQSLCCRWWGPMVYTRCACSEIQGSLLLCTAMIPPNETSFARPPPIYEYLLSSKWFARILII